MFFQYHPPITQSPFPAPIPPIVIEGAVGRTQSDVASTEWDIASDIFKTEAGEIPDKIKTDAKLTSYTAEQYEKKLEKEPTQIVQTTGLSNQYISFNLSKMIAQIKSELEAWLQNGTDGSLTHISNIKEILDTQSAYMTVREDGEILLGYLELLFTNNNWLELKKTQIRQFIRELNRFEDGEVSWEQLQLFSKQLFRSGISLLKYAKEKERKRSAD